jgi:hypothetical protein
LDAIREKQQADPILRQVLRFKNEDIKPPWEEINYESVNLKFWFARWESLEIKNGMLCMFWDDGVRSARWKICAPKSTLQTILWYLHDTKTAGHLGIKKTFGRANMSPLFWQNMQESVKRYLNQCEICGERKKPT